MNQTQYVIRAMTGMMKTLNISASLGKTSESVHPGEEQELKELCSYAQSRKDIPVSGPPQPL
jgi:hypothetical protein